MSYHCQDFSRLECQNTRLESHPFNLLQVMIDVHSLLRHTAQRKAIKFDVCYPADAPQWFVGDPQRIRQICKL
jgi:signal transduction histidine kinase